MQFSFGIITSSKSSFHLKKVIKSILKQNIHEDSFEIIVIGNQSKVSSEKIRCIEFDESIKPGWITKKKNIITKNSNFENIVFIHDYLALSNDWYKGFLKFGNGFDICMNKILNYDSTRFRDWTLWTENDNKLDQTLSKRGSETLIPYNVQHLSKFMYISGAYWVAKKRVMEKFPFNVDLTWGEGEDVEWFKRIREEHDFTFNPYSTTKLLKYKDPLFEKPNEKRLNEILEITDHLLS